MAKDEKGYDFSKDPEEKPAKRKRDTRPLPLTESLVFDIVDYLLAHEGYTSHTHSFHHLV